MNEHETASVGVQPPAQGVTGRLRGLLIAQFFGAFNDNAWRGVVTYLAISRMTAGVSPDQVEAVAQQQTTLATVVLTVPLILFSLPSGALNDRVSKRSVIVALKFIEILLMAGTVYALAVQPRGGVLALVLLGCLGAQSALFSPAKYGILPELLPHDRLSAGNGVLEMWSTLAIIAGVGISGPLLDLAGDRAWIAACALLIFAVAGFLGARTVPKVPAARPQGGVIASMRGGWQAIRSDQVLWLSVLGSIFFWLVASVLFQVIVVYVTTVLELSNTLASSAVGVLMVGIGAGSILAGRISRRRVEYGLIPLGATALTAFTLLFGILAPGYWLALPLLFAMGVAGGLINVPLNALKQWRSPADRRGAVLALSNIFLYAGILVGSLGAAFLAGAGVSTPGIIVATGVGVLVGTIWALVLMPAAFVRLVLVLATNTFYRLTIIGGEHIPRRGGALLVPNHVSFIDAFLLLASTDRPIRFLVDASFYHHRLLHPFMRSLGAIPISSTGGPKLILKALRTAGEEIDNGELVCIFPEGQITRIGMLLPFQRGFERIVKGRDVPIIPIYLDRVWGSIFSRSGGRFFSKVPAKIPYPVTIAIGRPLPAGTPIHEVRGHVRELGTESWMQQVHTSLPLHHRFVRQFRSYPWRLGFADQSRPHVSRFKSLVGVVALGRALRHHWQGQRNVGILLPASVGGALVNIAAAMAGKTAVNLNFTAGKAGMESAARQAKLKSVVTSGMFIAKAGIDLPQDVEPIWLEEVGKQIGAFDRVVAMLLVLFAPVRMLERACGAERPVRVTDFATIIFSSGSTGEPKGVPLTHFNIDSNLRGCLQIVPIGSKDRLLAPLPFFHSFGYTATLWMAANIGLPVIFHPSPLDAMSIGDLVRRYGVTIMFTTPTFMQLYTKRIAPGQFGSMRLMIAGAEKLQAHIADAFRDHFGIDPLEGYGVTETSPVIAVNVPDFRAAGLYQPGWRRGTVGQTIPGVSVRVIDPESHQLLGPGQEGMILVRGPNVMAGYLDQPELTESVFLDGWYVTGDIGRFDEDGFLTITDRYSRFSKIGGEMVPHGVVEEALERCSGVEDRVFAVTAIEDAKRGERLVVLHILDDDDLTVARERLNGMGLANLFIPRKGDYVRVAEIPTLGTGKTNLKAIKEIARERLATPKGRQA